jgi:hypothetical protein
MEIESAKWIGKVTDVSKKCAVSVFSVHLIKLDLQTLQMKAQDSSNTSTATYVSTGRNRSEVRKFSVKNFRNV